MDETIRLIFIYLTKCMPEVNLETACQLFETQVHRNNLAASLKNH